MAIRFYLHPKLNKKGEAPVTVSIMIRKTRLLTTLGYSISPSDWLESEEVKPRSVNSKGITGKTINNDIYRLRIHFNEYEIRQKSKPTVEDLKSEFKAALYADDHTSGIGIAEETEPQPEKINIFKCLKEFIAEQGSVNQWAYSTCQVWKTFTHHMETFSRRLEFEDFDERGLNRFLLHLRKTRGLEEKTVHKHYTNLKWFLNWAIRKGYTKEDTVNKYKPKFKVLKKPVIFLTKEELLKLYKYEIPANGTVVTLTDMNGLSYEKTVQESGALAKTRDLFCFCAFTSLRYSDMAALRRTDIHGDIIYVTTQKTNDLLPINLSKNAMAILDKYKDCQFKNGLALPVITNQKMNYYIKDLCELCGFTDPIGISCVRAGNRVDETFPKWELISTHAARRTFICFALSTGVPPQVVMKWTGHSDYKAMKPYIDIAEKTKEEAMRQIDNAWDM